MYAVPHGLVVPTLPIDGFTGKRLTHAVPHGLRGSVGTRQLPSQSHAEPEPEPTKSFIRSRSRSCSRDTSPEPEPEPEPTKNVTAPHP